MIACEKCAKPIYVYKYKSLPEEFSVRCSHCSGRGMYKKRAIAIEVHARAAQEAEAIAASSANRGARGNFAMT